MNECFSGACHDRPTHRPPQASSGRQVLSKTVCRRRVLECHCVNISVFQIKFVVVNYSRGTAGHNQLSKTTCRLLRSAKRPETRRSARTHRIAGTHRSPPPRIAPRQRVLAARAQLPRPHQHCQQLCGVRQLVAWQQLVLWPCPPPARPHLQREWIVRAAAGREESRRSGGKLVRGGLTLRVLGKP